MGATNNTVFNSYHQKKYDRNHHSSKVFPTPTNSHKFFTLPGITTHAPHIFHVQLHDDPHIVSPHPHETALHTPPCGTCAKLLSNHAIFPPHFKTIVPCHLEATVHGRSKLIQHHPFANSFGPCIYCGKLVAPFQHQFHFFHIPVFAILWISDRPMALLHHSSLVLLVYCCLLCFLTLLFSGQVFTNSSHSHQVSSSLKCTNPLYTGHPRFQTPFLSFWRCYSQWDPLKIPPQVFAKMNIG